MFWFTVGRVSEGERHSVLLEVLDMSLSSVLTSGCVLDVLTSGCVSGGEQQ